MTGGFSEDYERELGRAVMRQQIQQQVQQAMGPQQVQQPPQPQQEEWGRGKGGYGKQRRRSRRPWQRLWQTSGLLLDLLALWSLG